jgi:hypothetical protein
MKAARVPSKIIYQVIALLILFALSVKAIRTFASDNIDVMCRSKAKEIATQTYRTCVTENKTVQLDKLKKDFQSRMKNLKEEYEREVQRVGGKVAKNRTAKPSATPVSETPKADSNTDLMPSATEEVLSSPTNTDSL